MKNRVPLHAKVGSFFDSLYKSIRFKYHYIRRLMKYGECKYPHHSSFENDCIRILATGPSLKTEIEDLRTNGILFADPLFVMNFFAFSDLFVELKPTRYCLADPSFFKEDNQLKKVDDLFALLSKLVTWEMSLYIPNVSSTIAKSKIINDHIKLIPISTLHFEGFESKRYKYYKKGIATPSFVNVLIMIEYICLNEGFKKIYLYGADHSFLSNLMVDDNNTLRIGDSHFYGNATVARYHKDGTPWRIAEFIYDKYLTFVEHDVMRHYADYLGAEIINCTKCSLIDSYVRLSMIEKR